MSDFGLVGPAYQAPSIYQDCQELINWRPEKDPYKQDGERGQYTLYPTPGLILKCQLPPGEVRCMRAFLNSTLLLVVVGGSFYTVDGSFNATLRGSLATTSGRVGITDNGQAVYLCDGLNRYSWIYATNTFALATDGGFTGGDVCDTVDNYMVYNQPGTQNWGATSVLSVASPALSVGKKDGAPDNLVWIIVKDREIYLLGEYTTEVNTDVGTFPWPFARVPGTNTEHGLAAKWSVSRLGNSFAYVSQDRNGQGLVVVMNGYSPTEISTHAVTDSLANKRISDAVAFTYQLGGHECYVVTFPSIDVTWVYDAATSLWHKWMAWDSIGGQFHRHRANCQALFQGLVLVGDYQNGAIYALDPRTPTDNGATIRRLRRTPHIVEDFNQTYHEMLQIQFEPGIGLATGQGSNPQALLRWSNDGGKNWSNEHWRSAGKAGQYRNRAIWRKLGQARDRVYELSVSDPVWWAVVSAELRTTPGDN